MKMNLQIALVGLLSGSWIASVAQANQELVCKPDSQTYYKYSVKILSPANRTPDYRALLIRNDAGIPRLLYSQPVKRFAPVVGPQVGKLTFSNSEFNLTVVQSGPLRADGSMRSFLDVKIPGGDRIRETIGCLKP